MFLTALTQYACVVQAYRLCNKFPIIVYLIAALCFLYYGFEYYKHRNIYDFKWYELLLILVLLLSSVMKIANVLSPDLFQIVIVTEVLIIVGLCLIRVSMAKEKQIRKAIILRYVILYPMLILSLYTLL